MAQTAKNFDASAAIAAFSIAKPGATDGSVVPAVASTDKLLGVTTGIASDSGEPCDVILEGPAEVKLGGPASFGDLLTADANANAIVAAPAAGAHCRIVGIALESGVAGDVISLDVFPGQISA